MTPWPRPLPQWYFDWQKWMDGGRNGPRPVSVQHYLAAHGKLPAWAWLRYALHRGVKKPPAPPPTPPHTLQDLARNVLVCSDHARKAGGAPPRFSVSLSADPGENGAAQENESASSLASFFRGQGRRITGWGNQSQVGVETIKAYVRDNKLDGAIYQAESAYELSDIGIDLDGSITDGSLAATEPVILVGNPTAWTGPQRTTVIRLIAADRMAVIIEVYSNVQPWLWPNGYDSQGVPPASWCIALYNGSSESSSGRYVTAAEYKQHTDPGHWQIVSAYLTGGSEAADIAATGV